ncbi:MAG: DUF5689 domain-containing protein [Bacteroidia bacterium]
MISFNKYSKHLLSLLLLALVSFNFTACRDEEFDEPPINGTNPNLTVNMTIDSLKKLYSDSIISFNKIITIDSNWVISGVVTADDKSGNFYKTMVIEDATAGISIRLDQGDFYTQYPIGRRVYVKLKGLVMGDYGNLIQLGGYIDNTGTTPSAAPIPQALIPNYIVGGEWNQNLTPSKVTMNDLFNTDKWQNRLVEIENVEFAPGDTAQPFADAVLLTSVNHDLNDCNGNTIIVRTSGYSNFATKLTPTGKGTIKGIFSIYTSDLQLILRDSLDATGMDSIRCNGSGGTPTLINISDLRNLYSGSTINSLGNYYIQGVVISDRTNSNLNGKNLFIQDNTGGICVRFSSNHTFNLGDSLYINLAGQNMGAFNGLLQVGTNTPNVPNANATILATGKTVTPTIVTANQITTNMAGNGSLESSLVKVVGCTLSSGTGATTYSGSLTLNDATGTTVVYTYSSATFSGTTFPTGTVSVTGILGDFNGAQILMRSATDVQ